MQTLSIIDTFGYFFRNFYALPKLVSKSGFPTGVLLGFVNLINQLYNDESSHLIFALEGKGEKWRKHIYPPYKANRKDTPNDLLSQIQVALDWIKMMNLAYVSIDGFEADDAIATLSRIAKSKHFAVRIVSVDKDLYQLIDDNTHIFDPAKKIAIKEKECFEKFGVFPHQFVDYQSLVGDSSDNIAGVSGIGAKSAQFLISTFGSLDNLYNNIKQDSNISKSVYDKIIKGKDSAYLSQKLVRLRDDLMSDFSFDIALKPTQNPLFLIENELIAYDINAISKLRKNAESSRESTINSAINNVSTVSANFANANDLKSTFAKDSTKDSATNSINFTKDSVIFAKDFSIESFIKSHADSTQTLDFTLDSTQTLDSTLLKSFQKVCILEKNELFKIISLIPQNAFVAFDTETDSLDSNNANIVGFSFAFAFNVAFYVPLNHQYLGVPTQISKDSAKTALSELFKRNIIAHNAKFDIKIIWHNFSLNIPNIIDTMILSWLDSSAEPCGLDYCMKNKFDYETIKFSQIVPKDSNFGMINLDIATRYATEDAICTLALFEFYRNKKSLFSLAQKLEFPLITILAKMEKNGIGIDLDFFNELKNRLENKIFVLSKEIYALAGSEFNINSTQQLSNILFEKLGLKKGRVLKNKSHSTDEKTLESLKDSHKIIPVLLEYREINKLLNTYVIPFLNLNQNSKIYTSFLQTGTSTGRLSSKNPNLQNIPVRSEIGKEIRKGFISKSGYSFISADYSQIELRLLAHFSNDASLCKSFNENKDIHLETAIKLFSENLAHSKRNIAKSINFGLIYGMGARKLSQNLHISQNEAKSYIESYFMNFPTIKDFLATKENEILKNGYAMTLLGHKRKFDFHRIADYQKAAFLREGINAIFQGSAADLIKLAMIECNKFITNNFSNDEANMLLQIHDELIFEVRDDLVENLTKDIRNIMNSVYELRVPLSCGISIGKNLAELKE